jgi:alcohol dehydrogenase class IV
VAHGLSNSLVLPHVLRFNAAGSNAAAQEYSDMARICFPSDGLESLLPPWPTHLHGADALANGTKRRGVVVGGGVVEGGGGGVVKNIDI